MKKILLSIFAFAAITFSATAQDKTNGQALQKHHQKDGGKHDNMRHGMMKNLNLTDVQKQQLKSDNMDFKNRMQALKKNDNMSVKDFKAQKEALMQERKQKFESLLTPEQKAQMQKQKKDMQDKRPAMGTKRMDKMKTDLNLTDAQMVKMKALHENTKTQMASIINDQSLSREEKRNKIMSIKKGNKETIKNLLSTDQFKKMEEMKSRHHQDFKYKVESAPKTES